MCHDSAHFPFFFSFFMHLPLPTASAFVLALLLSPFAAAAPLDSWQTVPGEPELALRQQEENGVGNLSFILPDAQPRTLRLPVADFFGDTVCVVGSVRLLLPGQRVRLTLDTVNGSHQLADLRHSSDWQPFEATVPAGVSTGATQLRLQVLGPGMIEFRDLHTVAGEMSSSFVSPRSGWYSRFFQGSNPASAGWTTWTGVGTITHTFDLNTRKEGSRSIVLSSVNGYAYGATSATWENPARSFRVTGHARATGEMEECVVAIQFFGPDWHKLEWFTLTEVPTTGQWQKFDAVATCPEGTVRASLTLIFKGEGFLWLDEPLINVE
jgi:hypothetical protein